MPCAICESLKHAVEVWLREYQNASGWLAEMAASPDAMHYNRARAIAEDLRLEYELVRRELEQHEQTFHGTVN